MARMQNCLSGFSRKCREKTKQKGYEINRRKKMLNEHVFLFKLEILPSPFNSHSWSFMLSISVKLYGRQSVGVFLRRRRIRLSKLEWGRYDMYGESTATCSRCVKKMNKLSWASWKKEEREKPLTVADAHSIQNDQMNQSCCVSRENNETRDDIKSYRLHRISPREKL